jgi:hypothetical protein
MKTIEKQITYFSDPGPDATAGVLTAVQKRLKEGDINMVVVASTTGKTGALFARALKGKSRVLAISWKKMDPQLKKEIKANGAQVLEVEDLPLESKDMEPVKKAYYALGQGFKVVVEDVLIATDHKLVEPYVDVISVAGSDVGADTAVVIRTTSTREMFSEEKTKKLEIREVLAMPLKKMWY